ncbi:MAG TPA: hypothetical protein VN841_17900 [Bryobacteraceae bacterium]|nr:hypothetical protein [Bryobacteraceae bacterium]
MSLVSEAIARYHKLIESEPYIDLAWAQALQDRIKAQKLDGHPVSPVLRPHFLTNRDYAALERATGVLQSAIERVLQLALANPALISRLQLLPAERMMAGVDPGYKAVAVTSLLDSAVNDGVLHVTGYRADVPAGVLYGEALADVYYDCPPMKEFRKKYKLKKLGGTKPLLTAILKTYKESGGKQKKPRIAIVEFRQPFQTAANSEYAPLAEFLSREGYPTEVVSPEQLEYRNRELRRGDFLIDIVYRRINLQEFLVRYDLNHALVRAYKDRAVCMVNSFRAEMGSKRALLDLLTDEHVTAGFPAAERKAIKDLVPWTRLVQAAKTTHKNHTVDLPDFVLKHRTKLVLKPNDDSGSLHPVRGADVDDVAWEKALRQAMRTPSVVQETVEPTHAVFPLMQFGSLMMKDMVVHVHPHAFLGQTHGASSWLSVAGTPGFSTLTGLAPTFLLEGK